MAKILDINDFQTEKAAHRVGSLWRDRFNEPLSARIRLTDVSDRTLMELALLSRDTASFLYDLILGILDLGPAGGFDALPTSEKMRVLDAHLFLVDQVRWEVLGRVGLVQGYAAEEHPLIDLVLHQARIRASFQPPFPRLKETHPAYPEFVKREKIDGETMIRGFIPTALAAFGARMG
jgi:hypothetical protein